MNMAVALRDLSETAHEFKFVTAGLPLGEFKGYGAFFGNKDSHGDVIEPGAFADTLAERKDQGRGLPPMHVMHSIFGGDGLPIGKWLSVEENDKGLRVHGKISGMDTETGRLHHARIADGAYAGMSIGFSVAPGGSEEAPKNRKDGAKRLLKKINLKEISLVDDPSNALAKFDEMKSARLRSEAKEISGAAASGIGEDDEPGTVTPEIRIGRAAGSVRACMAIHHDCMAGGDAPTADERAEMLGHLQDAHEALTDRRVPEDMKAMPSIRDCETALRDAGLSRKQARDVVAGGLPKLLEPLRDAGRDSRATNHQGESKVGRAASTLDFLR